MRSALCCINMWHAPASWLCGRDSLTAKLSTGANCGSPTHSAGWAAQGAWGGRAPGMEGAETKRQRACPSCPCVWMRGMKPCAALAASVLSASCPSSATSAPASWPSNRRAASAASSASPCRARALSTHMPEQASWPGQAGLSRLSERIYVATTAALCREGGRKQRPEHLCRRFMQLLARQRWRRTGTARPGRLTHTVRRPAASGAPPRWRPAWWA